MYSINQCSTCFICRCVLRFPSTNIKIVFQNLVDSNENLAQPARLPSPPKRIAKPMPPLKINIPEQQQQQQQQPQQQQHHNVIADGTTTFVSPCPSPTGTIRSVPITHWNHQVSTHPHQVSTHHPLEPSGQYPSTTITIRSVPITHWNHQVSTHHPLKPSGEHPPPTETIRSVPITQ